MDYWLYIGSQICIFASLGVSLNILIGYAGMLSVCHAAFFGISAYATAILTTYYQWAWFGTIPVGVLLSSFLAVIIGRLSLRLRSDYLVVATFVIQVICYRIMQNWEEVTHGELGIYGIPPIHLIGWLVDQPFEIFIFSVILCGIVLALSGRIVLSPFGRLLRAIREDELIVTAAGKNVRDLKVLAFVTSASMAALAGSVYAPTVAFGHLDPSSFDIMESVFIIALMIIGGAGNLWGPVLGAVLLIILQGGLRFLDIPNEIAANIRQLAYGAVMVVLIILRPQGILGKYGFEGKREE